MVLDGGCWEMMMIFFFFFSFFKQVDAQHEDDRFWFGASHS